MGIFSSLAPQNVRLRRAIRDFQTAARHPLYPLLFDPQTAGGLLAAVPIERAERVVALLRAAGYAKASAIGIVSERSAALEPITLDLDGSMVAPILARHRAMTPFEAACRERSNIRLLRPTTN
jgi:selenide,water dikinase